MDYSIPIEEDFKLEFCFEGKDPGEGDSKIQRWYYDHEDGVCKDFEYGGEKGNRNRFLTRQSCESSCFEAQDLCELPKVIGPCNGIVEQFWYDKENDGCFSFNYGGCQGNGNKFDTLEFCDNRCKKGTGPRRGPYPPWPRSWPQPTAAQLAVAWLSYLSASRGSWLAGVTRYSPEWKGSKGREDC